jgi:hypothetical protein
MQHSASQSAYAQAFAAMERYAALTPVILHCFAVLPCSVLRHWHAAFDMMHPAMHLRAWMKRSVCLASRIG